jgi:hypothetical protein
LEDGTPKPYNKTKLSFLAEITCPLR